MVRTRFAPSPTGIPHIGGMRTALFAYLFARHNSGEFLLRIEDTDRKRFVKGSEEAIDESLNWLRLFPDKKFRQSERLPIYKEYAQKLLKDKKVLEKEGALFVHVPDDKKFSWTDAVGSKEISFNGLDVENFVIMKSDSFPTYHFANVIDDHLMEITHVMRGEEWISSTPKHLYLYELLGWKPPIFAHLPVILGSDHTKLSKRHGAKSALDYKNEGYLKEAILNYMALLGWNPGGEKEMMNIDEMISKFKLEDINTSNPIFDINKLNWMNGLYIRSKGLDELKDLILNFSPELKKSDIDLTPMIDLAKTRMTTLLDFSKFVQPLLNSQKPKLNKAELSVAKELKEKLEKVMNWNQENIFQALKEVLLVHKIKMNVIYKIVTGSDSGLPLPQALEIIGKERTLKKLNF